MRLPAFAALLLAGCAAAQPVDPWLDSPEAVRFRDRVVQLALIYGESNGIDPRDHMVRTRAAVQPPGGCAEVEVVTSKGEREVRREIMRACRAH